MAFQAKIFKREASSVIILRRQAAARHNFSVDMQRTNFVPVILSTDRIQCSPCVENKERRQAILDGIVTKCVVSPLSSYFLRACAGLSCADVRLTCQCEWEGRVWSHRDNRLMALASKTRGHESQITPIFGMLSDQHMSPSPVRGIKGLSKTGLKLKHHRSKNSSNIFKFLGSRLSYLIAQHHVFWYSRVHPDGSTLLDWDSS